MDFEKLGLFYLGRPYDLAAGRVQPGLTLYDSSDLVTHAVCVGMTGSGKTGLCTCLLEEAAIDGVPSIVIDPKGDMGNLLLTFPELRPDDFAPWIDPRAAERKGMTAADFAAAQAAAWRDGLAEWGQDGARIARLRASADFAVYTPGSESGRPVSILRSFAAPPRARREDDERLRERVSTTASSLLGLAGIEADPLRSREHILLATILERAWRAGRDMDLASVIQQIQTPPVAKVGVLDLEAFYPAGDRFALAMAINNLLASPGFSAWTAGDPLDVGRLLHDPAGRPRVSIFSIAHLADAERMFFVSLLLNEVLGWVRSQSGTTSLRAIVYMDEIAGYFPPVATPPSKAPLLTLLKQARAFGVGVVLATQNPVDLDYKGLANAGTWFLGRLQTERDKARVIEGLEGAASTAGSAFDRAATEQTLAALGNRVFLMHNVHERAPEVFQTRWALSYLRGPLTRSDIKRLSGDAAAAAPEPPAPAPSGLVPVTSAPAGSERPVLPPDIPLYFAPAAQGGAAPSCVPMLVGAARVRYVDSKARIDATEEVVVLTPVTDAAVPVDWSAATDAGFVPDDLAREPVPGSRFAPLPPAAARAASYTGWKKAFVDWLAASRPLTVYVSKELGAASNPGEGEREFRVRLQQAAREKRDEALARLRARYAPRMTTLQDRLRRAEHAVARETEQAGQQKLQTAISFGATLLGAVLGRKAVSASALGRATTTARGVGRSMREAEDVERARENKASIEARLAELERELEEETATLEGTLDPAALTLDERSIAARKSNVTVRLVALVWVPA